MRISDDRFLHCCNRRPRTGTGTCPSQAFSSGRRPRPTGRSRSVHPRSEDPCTGHRACPGPHPGAPGQRGRTFLSPQRRQVSSSFPPRDRSRPPGSWSPTGGYTLPGPGLPLKPDAAGHISAAVFLIFLDFCVGNIDGGREHLGDHQGSPARNPPR